MGFVQQSPFGPEEARIWGRLSAHLGHNGADLLIAATALARGAIVVTGNVTDKAYPFHSGKDDMLCPSHRRSWCSVPL